jgi:hypothetical protein
MKNYQMTKKLNLRCLPIIVRFKNSKNVEVSSRLTVSSKGLLIQVDPFVLNWALSSSIHGVTNFIKKWTIRK